MNDFLRSLVCSLAVILSGPVLCQSTSQTKAGPVKLSGGIGLNFGSYSSFGIENRRDPFQYLFSANLNIRVLNKIDIPLGVTVSQQETRFLQPNNIYGISPRYKDMTGHFGYRALSFSQYTLNNHLFLGGGLEFKLPTNKGPVITISGMYGRLRRAVEPGDAAVNEGFASYKRNGYGAKVLLANRKKAINNLAINVFRAEDRVNSIAAPLAAEIAPQENVAVGITGQHQLFGKLIASFDYGASALTRDTRAEGAKAADIPLPLRPLGGLINGRATTQYRDAYSTKLDYRLKRANIGLAYQRIDPDYQTLGSYFFQNNLENSTLTASWISKDTKVNLAGSFGVQRNGLEETALTSNRRLIGSLAYNHNFSDRLNWNVNFNNYTAALRVEREELTDSLNYYQISTNLSGGVNYRLEGDHTIYANASWQQGNSRDEYRIFDQQTSFVNLTGGWRFILEGWGLGINPAFNYSRSNTEFGDITRIGPSVNFNRQFLDRKINTSLALAYTGNMEVGVDGSQSRIFSSRINAGFKLSGAASINLGLAYFQRSSANPDIIDFGELRGRAGYRWRF